MDNSNSMRDSPAAMRDESKLDPVRKRLLELIDQSKGKHNLKSLSVALGRNPAYIQQFIDNGSPQELHEKDARKLAKILGVSSEELGVAPLAEEKLYNEVAPQNGGALTFHPGEKPTGPRNLPILGHVRAGQEGWFMDNGDAQGVTVRVDALIGVRDAYAVRVYDESMVPVYEAGELLYVDPTRPVKPGNKVIIQLHDGQAFVKRLLRRTDRAVICEQFNPERKIEFKPKDIRSIHRVIGTDSTET